MNYAKAYLNTARNVETPRQTEQAVFIRLTRGLESAEGNELIKILDENRRWWVQLMLDLMEPTNGHPQEIRASLISIGNWVNRHTSQVLAGNAKPDALAEVNRSMIRGLAATTPNTQEANDGATHHSRA